MPFGVANTNDGWDTDSHLPLLWPAHAQHALAQDARDIHKQRSSSRTGPDTPIAAAFAGPRPDSFSMNPMAAQMPVEMPAQNDNPSIQKGDTVAVDRSNLTPDHDLFMHSSVSPSVSSPTHHDLPTTPLFRNAAISDENRWSDFDWDEYLTFTANPDPEYLNTMSMRFPDCPIPDFGNDGDIAFYLSSPSPPRMQGAISSNPTMGYRPYQNLYVDQINAAGPGCSSTHSPSTARILGKRK